MFGSIILLALGCTGDKDASNSDSDGLTEVDSGANNMDSGGNANNCDDPGAFSSTISGEVSVSLWIAGDDGERESTTFDDAYGGSFPFGGIWVTAYEVGDDGELTYLAEDVIRSPTTSGNAYDLAIDSEACTEVVVFAVLDLDGDRVLDSLEPSGQHPNTIAIRPDTGHASDVDVDILTQGIVPGDGSGSGWGSGSGGGGTGEYITVSGDILVTTSYAAGDVAALVYETDGSGPLTTHASTPTASGSGAMSEYSFLAPVDYGDVQLLGAWDTDDNWLFDPTDVWGAYISEVDVDGNPLAIGSEDIAGADIQIPLADADSPFKVIPYLRVSGTITMMDGSSFDDSLEPDSVVWIAASKYKATPDASVESLLAESYDYTEITWAELTGNSSVAFNLGVPANNVIYLWAYTDEDGNGILNEPGEPVGAGGDMGKIVTGESDVTGESVMLNAP